MTGPRTITIGPDEAGQRLDRFLRKLLNDVSLNAIYKLVRTRQVTVNQKKVKPELRLSQGDIVTFFQAAIERHLQPKLRKRAQEGLSTRRDFRVVYNDAALVVVNKPAGVLVHAGDRGDDRDTLIGQVTSWILTQPQPEAEGLTDFVRPSPTFAPSLAHRIDRETSGLVLIGKTLAATQALAAQIKHRDLQKTYLALAIGGLRGRQGEINVPIARQEDAKGRRRKVETGHGQKALTRYQVLGQRGQYSLVELELVTGRTHQIRAHLAHMGAPVAGDDEYGSRDHNRHAAQALGLSRQWLHAARLQLQHPLTGQPLDLCAPLWPDLRNSLQLAGLIDCLPDWMATAREVLP